MQFLSFPIILNGINQARLIYKKYLRKKRVFFRADLMHYRLVAAQSFSPLLIQPKSHYYLPIIFGPKRKKFPESPFPDLF